MSKVQTSLRIDEKSLNEAKVILNSLGMNFTEAVNVFTSMVVQTQGLPFEVKIPNKETVEAIKQARKGINIDAFSVDELK
ncbi:MAG: type II toxin-antitoxin system antitoxin, RelB/DinJ family [Methylophaga sp.]|nr:MAG: type II toxin-antitoxin system antitoxin, RelB/DinJ family [Methylophaga sp.]